jgi:hypothetical protein
VWAADVVPPAVQNRAQTVTVSDPEATEAFRTRLERIRSMVDRGLTNVTGKATVAEACRSLVGTQQVVGIKVYSTPGPYSGTRPAVVEALVKNLLEAGVPATNIVIWDRQMIDLRLAGFLDLANRYGVRVAGAVQAGYDPDVFYESPIIGNLVWGDLEFGKRSDNAGRKSFLSRLVSRDLTRIINVAPMLNHNTAGVSGNLFSLASGSVDNFARFEPDEVRMATAVPEIYGLPALFDKVVLNITDALICQYEGGERGLLHYSATLNELRFSRDAVALDVLSVQELDRLRKAASAPTGKANKDLYNNAALLELGVSDPKRIDTTVLRQSL